MAQVLSFLLQSFLVCLVFSLAHALEEVEVEVTFDARAQPHQRLLLIMLDGFRYDYLENRDYDFPGFEKVIRRGAKPKYMIPDFPTLSYPNYYSFMTGEIPFFSFFLFLVRCLVGWFEGLTLFSFLFVLHLASLHLLPHSVLLLLFFFYFFRF